MKRATKKLFVSALSLVLGSAAPAPRVLHVSMYPYIPEAADAALTLKQGFELAHPGVLLQMTFNPNYFDPTPEAHGVLNEDADVHEIDAIFLRDFIDRHKLAPLSPAFAAGIGALVPLAEAAATSDGRMVAVPHWLCSDFLIYRADESRVQDVQTLAGLAGVLHPALPGSGLLLDMTRPALGELVLAYRLGEANDVGQAVSGLGDPPGQALIDAMRQTLALEPRGFGRDLDYDSRPGFYARQFARRAGGAFVGYSEATHDVLDETATSCRHEDHCVGAADIRVAAWPPSDGRGHRAVWVDMYGIDAKVHGPLHDDAEAFIRYATSAETYRELLVPKAGAAPRYLLPAREGIYHDPLVLKAAPLYPRLRSLIDNGVTVSAPQLNTKLHAAAAAVDAALR